MAVIQKWTTFRLAELVLANMQVIMSDEDPHDIFVGGWGCTRTTGLLMSSQMGEYQALVVGNHVAIEQIDVYLGRASDFYKGTQVPRDSTVTRHFQEDKAYQAAEIVVDWLCRGRFSDDKLTISNF